MAERRPEPRAGNGPARRRRFDFGSWLTGLFFLLVAAVFLVGGLSDDPIDRPQVIAPALVVGLGLVGIVRVLTRSRRHR
ncbi:hypothetical protein [Actinomadura sp. SCN-SB]|uniref:hypothetical protein n=1 Tax=Actinomadura sp. SCN-SB TaxID=3373092 RepID=UPI003751219A